MQKVLKPWIQNIKRHTTGVCDEASVRLAVLYSKLSLYPILSTKTQF